MFRYMALIWNTANQRQSEAALLLGRRLQTKAEWQEVVHQGGLRVLCANARPGGLEPRVFGNGGSVVLGYLFERNVDPEDSSAASCASLGTRQSAAILHSRGKRLISSYWGNYVAFLQDPDQFKVWVVKDPAGSLPCHSTVFRGVTVFFSCMADCTDLQLLSFTMNTSYLRNRVIRGGEAAQDALNEVSQVHRGECVEVDPRYHPGQLARHLYWNPLSFSESDTAIEDPARAARELRATVRSCAHTWACHHDGLLLRLSGGLDSSIVASCLKDAPTLPRVTAYTYFDPRAFADERPWAQLAATHAGCEHVECATGPRDLRLALMHRMRATPAPVSVLEYLQRSSIDAPLAAQRSATAIFTGDGGGFHGGSGTHAVTAYLQRHGLRPEAWRIAAQVALCTHRSTFTVLSHSLRGWLLGAQTGGLATRLENSRLVNPDVVETLRQGGRYPHPWYRSSRPPWTAIRQLEFPPAPADFYNAAEAPDALAPEMISPLYSQPALELFLRIPLYVHFAGGRDRGLARRAFGEDVPKPILRRTHKERTPALHQELVRRNRAFLRELFMDGVLIGEGLLSRAAVDAALSGMRSKDIASAEEIFRHLDTEIWARHWVHRTRRGAAGSISEPLLFVARGSPSQ